MIWLLHRAWRYRNEIYLAMQLLSAMRKTAAELTREYIRQRIQ